MIMGNGEPQISGRDAFEEHFSDMIYLNFEENWLFRDNLYQCRSCLTNFIKFLEVTKAIDEDVDYMNFSKECDKVDHGRLIQEIKMHRIHGDLVVWIQICRSHRRQMVVVEVGNSSWRSVTSGLRQGSFLDLCCM